MQRRFESDPPSAPPTAASGTGPQRAPIYPHPAEVSRPAALPPKPKPISASSPTPNTPAPEVHLLSNGRYHVAVTAAGGGYSRWRDLAVTRWHEDPTRDCWGTFCYLRDVETGDFWSAAHQPTLKRRPAYEAIYSQGRAEFRRRDGDIDTHVEISVSPEDDIELRRISITNRGDAADHRADQLRRGGPGPARRDPAHPAFSNLFVQTRARARSPGDPLHPPPALRRRTPAVDDAPDDRPRHGRRDHLYETDRAEFIGRGRSVADPAAMHRPA